MGVGVEIIRIKAVLSSTGLELELSLAKFISKNTNALRLLLLHVEKSPTTNLTEVFCCLNWFPSEQINRFLSVPCI